MSSREPLWYCHECHAEMRPLMVPDPHCASCNGSFVERIENPADDPRAFQSADGGQWDDGPLPGEMDAFPTDLWRLLRGSNPSPPTAPSPASAGASSSSTSTRRMSRDRPQRTSPQRETQAHTTGRNNFTIRIERSGAPDGRARTVILGGSPSANNNGEVPRLSQYAPPRSPGEAQPNITGPLLAQYLLAFMGSGRGTDPFSELLGGMFGPGGAPGGGSEPGRWGDYVFNQEALDQIITQIMENNNAHQPVPANEEVVEKLPREVLEEGCPMLEKDCAVCKEQFKLQTEDPDEQVVITLPCQHPFHEPCILPWLKTSGTCPVCRYQLVPQPGSNAAGPGSPSSGSSRSNSSGSSGGNNSSTNTGGGLFQNMFGLFSHPGAQDHRESRTGGSSGATHARTTGTSSGNAQSSSRRDSNYDIPGGWSDQVD